MKSAKRFLSPAVAFFAIVLLGVALVSPPVLAQPLPSFGELPSISVNPIVNELDGRATFDGEWDSAAWGADPFPREGTAYGERKEDWLARSSNPIQYTTYPGNTVFLMHDISGLTTQDPWDYNTFDFFDNSGGRMTAWVFGNNDNPNDQDFRWIGGSGLNYQTMDDRGFLVRKDNDATTDRHWYPGNLEPGDWSFIWPAWHGFFGSYGFNNSTWQWGLPNSTQSANEVYEIAIHGDSLPGIPYCSWWYWEACDPDSYVFNGAVIHVNWLFFSAWFHVGGDTFPAPPPVHGPLGTCYNWSAGAHELEWCFPNQSDSTLTYDAIVTSARGWPISPPLIHVNLGPHSDSVYTLTETIPTNAPWGTRDTIQVASALYTSKATVTAAGPLDGLFLVPNTPTLQVGEAVPISVHGRDSQGRILPVTVTSCNVSNGVGIISRLADVTHAPREYDLLAVKAIAPGSGTITVTAGTVTTTAPFTVTAAIPNLDVDLTPINPPINIPPQGGSFNFIAAVQRVQGPQAGFYAWARNRYPNGTYSGILLGPVNINPPVGVTVTRQRTQVIPASWPSGVHYYIGYAHSSVSYPATDADSFSWVKMAGAPTGPMIWETANYGEPFPGEVMGSYQTPAFSLKPCKPNPFNASTTISYELRAAGLVNLKVYDAAGRLVTTLVDGYREEGSHQFTLDGTGLATGIYLLRMQVGNFTAVQKMVLVK